MGKSTTPNGSKEEGKKRKVADLWFRPPTHLGLSVPIVDHHRETRELSCSNEFPKCFLCWP